MVVQGKWRLWTPLAVAILIALAPVPHGLPEHAWYYFAIFAGVVVGLILEPFPAAAVGLMGVTATAVLSKWVLFSPIELASPDFSAATRSIEWALSGFANSTIWLSFAAFMFAAGYQKTGLGRRIALLLVRMLGGRTLSLGYAIVLADAILAPFTPSNTARSAGTIFPIIQNLPPLYDSHPFSPSARKIGGYVMWNALAATSVTSSLFLTALAPNLLALEFIRTATGAEITWTQWFLAGAPAGVILLLTLPLLTYVFYAPQITEGGQAPDWAARELKALGDPSRSEYLLAAHVILAMLLWIFGSAYLSPTTAALVVVSLMLLTGVVTFDDVVSNREAWKALMMLATLVTLAGGLSSTGFVRWFAEGAAGGVAGMSPLLIVILLTTTYFFTHYLFASITAHVTAMMPIMLSIGASVPGLPLTQFALLLALTHGLMGVLTPYATTSGPVYLGSGYITSAEFWRLGAIFGTMFLIALLALSAPFLFWMQWI
jgi:L-tartrate/succinate antiporter